jgi:hypothetical protein
MACEVGVTVWEYRALAGEREPDAELDARIVEVRGWLVKVAPHPALQS